MRGCLFSVEPHRHHQLIARASLRRTERAATKLLLSRSRLLPRTAPLSRKLLLFNNHRRRLRVTALRPGKGSIGELESLQTSISAASESPAQRSTPSPGGSIVRVTDTSGNVGVNFVLGALYFVKEWLPQRQSIDFNCNEYAIGPFVAIEVGGGATATPTTSPITGYALGVMVGLHHPTTDPKLGNSSWNFGVGLRVDPSATVFGDGVRANQAPPPGVTTADQLLKTEPRYGLMLLCHSASKAPRRGGGTTGLRHPLLLRLNGARSAMVITCGLRKPHEPHIRSALSTRSSP